MPQPINYLGMMPQEDFTQSILGGLQVGQAFAANRLAKQKQEQALLLQQQYAQDTQAALANPTPQAFAALTLKYPQQRESVEQGWKTLSAGQQQAELRDGSELLASLHANRPDVAMSKLDERITAAKNSGKPTGELETLRGLVEKDPKQAYGYVMSVMSAVPGGDKVLEGLTKAGVERRAEEMQPAAVAKATADAQTAQIGVGTAESNSKIAQTKAKYAESAELLSLEKQGWDIKALQADIGYKRESNRIAAMNAATAREGNSLKRQELQMKVDEAVAARDDKIRAKVADAQSSASTIDNMLNTVERLKKNPRLNSVLGVIEGRLPAMGSDESADAIALIETLGSQTFLAQIPVMKGMGALSEKEGDKLQSGLQNLSRVQSETQFRANLDEVVRTITKARKTLELKTGVPFGKPDTPAAPGARPPLDSFNR